MSCDIVSSSGNVKVFFVTNLIDTGRRLSSDLGSFRHVSVKSLVWRDSGKKIPTPPFIPYVICVSVRHTRGDNAPNWRFVLN